MQLVHLRLVGALDDQFVDADVRRTARGPHDRFGNIFGAQGNDAVIHLLCAGGVTVEPVTVQPGGTLADVKVTASSEAPVPVVLEATTAGKVLGKSNPILIDPAARVAAAPVISDEN